MTAAGIRSPSALAASAGKEPGSRPTVRLFVTHAVWNDAARLTLSGRTQEAAVGAEGAPLALGAAAAPAGEAIARLRAEVQRAR